MELQKLKISNGVKKQENNFAYIDGANLHKGIKSLGWQLDYRVFRRWLEQKYNIEEVYLFIGLVPKHKDLYTFLQKCGYILVYKEVTYDGDGKVKGNCDADLVLNVMRDFYERNLKEAVLVTSDGDYSSLVTFLKEKGVFRALLSPSNSCSFLLRKLNIPIVYLNVLQGKLATRVQKEKAPGADESAQGSLS